jgi:hypothetical protein
MLRLMYIALVRITAVTNGSIEGPCLNSYRQLIWNDLGSARVAGTSLSVGSDTSLPRSIRVAGPRPRGCGAFGEYLLASVQGIELRKEGRHSIR